MKKLIILMLALGLSSTIFAQLPAFCIGPKIGYNTTKLSTDASSITSDLKSNFQFGAFVRIGDKIYFQPEVNYVTKGGQLNSNSTSNTEKITLKTLTMPFLLGVKIIDLKLASVHLVGGPVASIILDKKLDITNPSDSWPVNSTDDIKNSAWSIQAGAGVDVMMFTLDIRYEIGLSDLNKGSNFSLKNNLLNVSLGLKLL